MAHGYFSAVVDAFAGERELVLVDLPGHGDSARPSPRRFAYDFVAYGRVLGEVLDALRLGEVDVLGHSLGGGVGLRFCAARRDVARAVLVSPLAFPLPLPPAARLLSLPVVGRALWHGLVARRDFSRQLREGFDDPAVAGDAYVDWAYDHFQRAGGRRAALAAFCSAVNVPDDAATFRELTQPVLLVWGDGDRLVPLEQGRRLAAALPRARLEVIPASRHTPFVERPALFVSRVRDFLQA
jgi:pimeloyl-ACP methyl ester carboxylesterase